ncbi:uncharacterized protein LOC132739727 [Ruditapes philippinarum]|uniref:uncharacterized protein LOC132739727 n=1 Tax=Ruditapes philippinarum TaxID=129788 RepID=UPI00295B6515|nr:uncharacterized protein LOC132739727 [Ruditapes philippinarum]
MGCNVSINEDKAIVRDRDRNDYEKNAPIVSEAEKMIIQNNWQTLKLHIANIGVITYVSLFESRPELINTFSKFEGKDVYKLQESGLLQKHALRVMATIDKCVTCINEHVKLIHILREVGHYHRQNNVRSIDIQVILPHFLCAMKPYSQGKWCEEIQRAWANFLSFIVYYIQRGMQQKHEDSVNNHF